jgi:hypothetical protein
MVVHLSVCFYLDNFMLKLGRYGRYKEDKSFEIHCDF